MNNKYIFVGSVGASRGAFAAGVISTLAQCHNITFKAAAGNSVGSLIAAAIAMDMAPEVGTLFSNLTNKDVYRGKPSLWSALKAFVLGRNYINDSTPLYAMIHSILQDNMFIMPCYIGVTNLPLRRIEYHDISRMNVDDATDILHASCTMPLLWEPVLWRNYDYVDGGLIDMNPVVSVKSLFQPDDVLLIVNSHYSYDTFTSPLKYETLGGMAQHTFSIMQQHMLRREMRMMELYNTLAALNGGKWVSPEGKTFYYLPYHIIEPQHELFGSPLDFSASAANVALGKDHADQFAYELSLLQEMRQ